MKPTDVRAVAASLRLLPVTTRVPLKFGAETLTEVTCARVEVEVESADGRRARGLGETPLSVQWVWPSALPYAERHAALQELCVALVGEYASYDETGHALEVGLGFVEDRLPEVLRRFNRGRDEPAPRLAALVCASAFDIALHDAYGRVHDVPVWDTYDARFLGRDLADLLRDDAGPVEALRGRYPADFVDSPRRDTLDAWHLVGGRDAIDASDLTGEEPDDGYPVLLEDWIERDGLRCLKIKLRGDDEAWDLERLVRVGRIASARRVLWLSADFNCTVKDPEYVCRILDRLLEDEPDIYARILYVEQPFPYDLESHAIDVRSVSARKPLFMDESAHDWKVVRLGRELGWTGVALKTCKTQSGALASLCWARAHGMTLMVQDLTNPMLAQIPHVLLAAHARTIRGVETNAMQFYPEASCPEAAVHPGLYRRRDGRVDLSTIRGPGFGYRAEEVARDLPAPVAASDA